jgi:hypothetical protein
MRPALPPAVRGDLASTIRVRWKTCPDKVIRQAFAFDQVRKRTLRFAAFHCHQPQSTRRIGLISDPAQPFSTDYPQRRCQPGPRPQRRQPGPRHPHRRQPGPARTQPRGPQIKRTSWTLVVTCLLTTGKPFRGIAAAVPIIKVDPINATAANAAIFRLGITSLLSSNPVDQTTALRSGGSLLPPRGRWPPRSQPAAIEAISGVEFAKSCHIRTLVLRQGPTGHGKVNQLESVIADRGVIGASTMIRDRPQGHGLFDLLRKAEPGWAIHLIATATTAQTSEDDVNSAAAFRMSYIFRP